MQVRLDALKLAASLPDIATDDVVLTASVFEDYIVNGLTAVAPAVELVQDAPDNLIHRRRQKGR